MHTLGFGDPLPPHCTRILVAGTAGAGKTTLANRLADIRNLPRFEMDNLHWDLGWRPRPTFLHDVASAVKADAWVTEWQYADARPVLASRAHAMIWLDYSVPRRMYWVARRTLVRRTTRQPLWEAGLREEPLHTFFTNKDHIIRWAWRTRGKLDHLPHLVRREYPHLELYRFTSPQQVQRWLHNVPS